MYKPVKKIIKEYALYKGENLLCIGTIKEISENLKIEPDTVRFYGTNVYKKRIAKRKKNKNCRELVKLN